jgi:hypothetical protein
MAAAVWPGFFSLSAVTSPGEAHLLPRRRFPVLLQAFFRWASTWAWARRCAGSKDAA